MANDHHHRPPPKQESRIQQSRFKTLRNDAVFIQLERVLRQINRWDDPVVQQQMRLFRFGTETARTRAFAQLMAIIKDYRARTVAYQDAFMPYATADQIGNGGRGVHILDQANSGVPFNLDEDLFLLDALILGRQGGGKSSAQPTSSARYPRLS